MKKYVTEETFILKEKNTLLPIQDSLQASVYLNDALLVLDKDYTVDDDNTIVIDGTIEPNSTVVVSGIIEGTNNSEIINPGKASKPNSIIHKYSTEEGLKLNNKYTLEIVIDDEPITSTFTSKLSPMFATVKKVRELIGEFIPDYSDSYIESVIYNNSVAVIELIDELKNSEDEIENVHYQVQDGIYTTEDRAVKNWVLYRTCIDLIYAKYFGISYNYGSIKKAIGDITVEKSTKLPYIDNLLSRFLKQFDEADSVIRGFNVVAGFVKAGDNFKYDSWDRTTLFSE